MTKIKTLLDIPSVNDYLRRIAAEPRSLNTAVVKEMAGKYWRDVAVIRISKEGAVTAPTAYLPTDKEKALIEAECQAAEWPAHVPISGLINEPPELKNAPSKDKFIFYDAEDRIIMVQQRIANKKGERAYVPWTYWDDGEWRKAEPEGKLPLWGIEQLESASVAFIHEGAKAARFVKSLVNPRDTIEMARYAAHPWADELSHAAHLGWIGGALSPSRTDWSVLKKAGIKRAYIVSDNDEPGVAAVPSIAFQLRMPTFHVQFTSEWPASFDLADDFPKKMFKEIEGRSHYIGPSFRSCVHPATWATDQIPNKRGKPTTVLREEFKNQWAYIEEVDTFIHVEMPEIMRAESVMNKMLSGFSHVNNTSQLMVRNYRGRRARLCYRPDKSGRIISDQGTSAINLHQPTTIKAVEGDISPWIEFLEYMFPEEGERQEMARWLATLIAKPETRMEYGVLLVSETQGVGKTTLGAKILAPLVGDGNVGFPTEREIVDSNFNGWLAHKRLVIVSEIYSGHSWKAYNTLKGYITDKDIQVNEKYMRPYRIENWVHIFASSNSKKGSTDGGGPPALVQNTNTRKTVAPRKIRGTKPMDK